MILRYRAYDTATKQMLPVTRLDWQEWWVEVYDESIPEYRGERYSFNNEKTDRYLVMESTGYLDEDGAGKMIFDGDVCSYEYEEMFNTVKLIGVVEYSDTDACWGLMTEGHWTPLGDVPVVDVKVIGNIHENLELLTEESCDKESKD